MHVAVVDVDHVFFLVPQRETAWISALGYAQRDHSCGIVNRQPGHDPSYDPLFSALHASLLLFYVTLAARHDAAHAGTKPSSR